MALTKIEVDTDVQEMAIRIASRIGKSLSETLQDGLIYIARAHNWSVEVDPDEQLYDGEREEVYLFWHGLDPAQREVLLELMADPDGCAGRIESLGEQKKLLDEIAMLRPTVGVQEKRITELEEKLVAAGHRAAGRADGAGAQEGETGPSVELSIKVSGEMTTEALLSRIVAFVDDFRERGK